MKLARPFKRPCDFYRRQFHVFVCCLVRYKCGCIITEAHVKIGGPRRSRFLRPTEHLFVSIKLRSDSEAIQRWYTFISMHSRACMLAIVRLLSSFFHQEDFREVVRYISSPFGVLRQRSALLLYSDVAIIRNSQKKFRHDSSHVGDHLNLVPKRLGERLCRCREILVLACFIVPGSFDLNPCVAFAYR